jgi:Tol biopolymer transport system component
VYQRETSALNTVALIGIFLMCCAMPIRAQGPEVVPGVEQRAGAGTILFGSQGNFWVINPDGSSLKKITNAAAAGDPRFSATWSRDGNKLAFVAYRLFDSSNGQFKSLNVWVMNADGSGLRPITSDPKRTFYDVTWSPDGRKLAATCALVDVSKKGEVSYSSANVCIVNADGSGVVPVTRLINNHTVIENIVWSPDGRKVAFLSNRLLDGSEDEEPFDLLTRNIWVMDPDGSHALPLTHFTGNNLRITSFAWSPDGRKLAYISNRALDGSLSGARGRNLWLIHADGSSSSPLTRFNQADCRAFSWSPDGTRLAFASNFPLDGSDHDGAPSNIWVMKFDGSAAVPLTSATTLVSRSDGPVWSPDGSLIAFASCTYTSNLNPSSECNLWVMKEDGSGARPLTSDGKSGEAFLWRP